MHALHFALAVIILRIIDVDDYAAHFGDTGDRLTVAACVFKTFRRLTPGVIHQATEDSRRDGAEDQAVDDVAAELERIEHGH